MARSFGGELSETKDMSGLVPHRALLLSGKKKDTQDELHQSANQIAAHHLQTINTY